jgi:glycosyltransferase involved in cell wall biosynthesis
MKIIFDVEHPFAWADGGASILCERVMEGLQKRGVEAEPLRWWDRQQGGTVLQTFGVPNQKSRYAAAKGLKVFPYVFLDGITSMSRLAILARMARISLLTRLSSGAADQLGYRMREFSTAFIVPSPVELPYLSMLYGIEPKRTHVILHGVDPVYRQMHWSGGSDYLICIGTICRRKNSLYLAQLANRLQIPVRFLGRIQEPNAAYVEAFRRETNSRFVTHMADVSNDRKLRIMQEARAFILLSRGESGSIATLEALAIGMPVILPDYDWATGIYRGHADFIPMANLSASARALKAAYEKPPVLPAFPVDIWDEVAGKYLDLYMASGVQ